MNKSKPEIAFRDALWFWLKLGFVSFGGPAGQISIMHDELVTRRKWISDRRFLHALNFTMILPGPEAQQLATYIGWLMHGVRGGLAAGLLFILPSFFILGLMAWLYLEHGDLPLVQGVIYGIKPAVVAIVAFAAYRIGLKALSTVWHWLMAALAFLLLTFADVPFPYIVLGAAIIGIVVHRVWPGVMDSGASGHAAMKITVEDAIIGDATAPPEHAVFSWIRLSGYIAAGIVIWGCMIGALTYQYGWGGLLTQMGWFFSKAAMVTFGGAYAVLPYVYQGGVETYGWLTGPQMIDGLALGETTPGPLIMIVTFVGYVGGWTGNIAGIDSSITSAWLAAFVATSFTFLPSFVFILAGGPVVESSRNEVGFTAPLSAITAAVVGVILNLAVFFAMHVLWPDGLNTQFDVTGLAIGLAAFMLIWRFKINIITVILLCALIGFVIHLLPF